MYLFAINYEAKSNTNILRKKMSGITWKHKKTAKWIREQTKFQDIVKTIKMELGWT